jgi:hypothetical protein
MGGNKSSSAGTALPNGMLHAKSGERCVRDSVETVAGETHSSGSTDAEAEAEAGRARKKEKSEPKMSNLYFV